MFDGSREKKTRNLHVAIIMDGNGRWALRQGKPRFFGHQVGAQRVRDIVEAAARLPISVLTLFAFSSDNWRRPDFEVNFLMQLLKKYLQSEIENCRKNGIKLSVIGRRDRLDRTLCHLIQQAETLTVEGKNLHLRVAIDYSARDAILQAARKLSPAAPISRDEFAGHLNPEIDNTGISSDVDLLIRTGGEKRLSDFLLWESAYAELFFTRGMWPEFTGQSLKRILRKYHGRERRFGRIPLAEAI